MEIKNNLYRASNFENSLSLEEVINQNNEKILNLIYGMTGDYHLAQDLTQETFLKAFQAIKDFNGKSKISTWLYRIAVNVTIDHQRKSFVQKESPSDVEESDFSRRTDKDEADQQCQKNAIKDILYKTISKMPEQQKEVFILKEINGCTNKEVAEIVGCSLELAKWRLHKARLYLRKELKKVKDYENVGKFTLNQFGLE